MLQVPEAVWDVSVELDGCDTAWYEVVATTSVNLSQNSLKQLPPEVSQLEELAVLNVSANELSDLPETLQDMACLKVLDISSNRCALDIHVAEVQTNSKWPSSRLLKAPGAPALFHATCYVVRLLGWPGSKETWTWSHGSQAWPS